MCLRWTIIYQNANLLIYIWATIFRLVFAYGQLAKEIRDTHSTRQASKVERMEAAIRKWRFTIALIIGFTIALTTLRLLPTSVSSCACWVSGC